MSRSESGQSLAGFAFVISVVAALVVIFLVGPMILRPFISFDAYASSASVRSGGFVRVTAYMSAFNQQIGTQGSGYLLTTTITEKGGKGVVIADQPMKTQNYDWRSGPIVLPPNDTPNPIMWQAVVTIYQNGQASVSTNPTTFFERPATQVKR